jgi:hypothetical protein
MVKKWQNLSEHIDRQTHSDIKKICIITVCNMTQFYDDMLKYISDTIETNYENITSVVLSLKFPKKEFWTLQLNWFIEYADFLQTNLNRINADLYLVDSSLYFFMMTFMYTLSLFPDRPAYLIFYTKNLTSCYGWKSCVMDK